MDKFLIKTNTHHIDDKTPKGLHYFQNAISEALYNEIMEWWRTPQVQALLNPINRNGTFNENTRKVIQYGSLYLYDKREATSTGSAPKIPDVLKKLKPLILKKFDIEEDHNNLFDQVIINRYLPGQGIAPHTDLSTFGKYIASFTFMHSREMEFTRGNYEPYKIYVNPRSLYVMSGESRYKWKHQMRPRLTDNGICRQECFSITFRSSPNK